MGILDSGSIQKLQENLISKGDQNRDMSRDFGIINGICKYFANSVDHLIPPNKNNPLSLIADVFENNQLCLGGRSRDQFLESIKNQKVEPEITKLGEKQ